MKEGVEREAVVVAAGEGLPVPLEPQGHPDLAQGQDLHLGGPVLALEREEIKRRALLVPEVQVLEAIQEVDREVKVVKEEAYHRGRKRGTRTKAIVQHNDQIKIEIC